MSELPVSAEILGRLDKDVIEHSNTEITVHEPKGSGASGKGKGTLFLKVSTHCIRIRIPDKNGPAGWLTEQKCADAIVIEFSDDGPMLHLIELKSKMTRGQWRDVKKQLLGAYHNALAIGGVLELPRFAGVRVHVLCSEDSISPAATANSSTLKAGLGKPLPDTIDWVERRLTLDGIAGIPLDVTLRDEAGNARARLR
jgi:hypothetical protein